MGDIHCRKCGKEYGTGGHPDRDCDGAPPDDESLARSVRTPLFTGRRLLIAAVLLLASGGIVVLSDIGGIRGHFMVDPGYTAETDEPPVADEPDSVEKVLRKPLLTLAKNPDDKPVAPPAATVKVAPPPPVGSGPVLIVTVDTATWKLKSSIWKVPPADVEGPPVANDRGLVYTTKDGKKKYRFAFAKVDWNSPKPQEVALLTE